MYMYGLKKSK